MNPALKLVARLTLLAIAVSLTVKAAFRKPTEKERYLARIKKLQKEEGLRAVHVTTSRSMESVLATLSGNPTKPKRLSRAEEEELYAELNRMLDAPDQADPEVLGKYSPVL